MPFDTNALAFGDIVLVPFPFTDQTAAKKRPAVIISSDAYNARHPDVVLMPVTSQLRADARPNDMPILQRESAGLLKPSAIKPLIATLERSLIIRKLGVLNSDDCAMLREGLRSIIG